MLPDARTYLEMSFQPTVDLISTTRRFVCAYYEPLLGDEDLVSRIGLATHELLENILKYAIDGHAVTRVKLVPEGNARKLCIATTSRLTEERRAGLEEIFAEMANAGDSTKYFHSMMLRARHRRHCSGLGLARIWAEAEMTLSLDIDGDVATISACAIVPDEDAS